MFTTLATLSFLQSNFLIKAVKKNFFLFNKLIFLILNNSKKPIEILVWSVSLKV